MSIEIFPLGAGKEVGRSCIIVNILDKTIMFDCGLHMTHCDNRRFPDFDVLLLFKINRKFLLMLEERM